MSEQMNTPMLPPPSGISEWFSVWRDAVTKPSEQTFSRIALSPNAKLTTAFLWVFLGSLVSAFLSSLVQGQVMRQMMQSYGMEGLPQTTGNTLIAAICGAPVAALISVLLFALVTGIIQVLAKMFGGRGTFEQLAYAFAAITTPFSLISGVLALLSAIPWVGACFGIVGLLAGLYVVVLEVMAVKGVNQFGWGQAIGSFFLPVLVLCCCLSVGVFAILQALGPTISDTFETILTPMP
ncbi:MAG: YIP1 family protein [Anaerolineales bacterium]|nr:YIP1 family protein [Anaerolineales bacterium]